MTTADATLTSIPVIDVREGGTLRHARERVAQARALRDECLAWFPRPARPLVPFADGMAKRWLLRSRSPYIDEVAAIADELGFPGVWFLNGSYQWGCTTIARDEDGAPWLARTLDWPFPGLGRNADVVRMQGPAGEFYSITWAGYVGALTAMAPGRFAAAINQGPLKRRSETKVLRFFDIAANAVRTWRHVRHIPPDQLLRQVFETCRTFDEARAQLETVPVARPVIYTLAGLTSGQRCVIERTEDDFNTCSETTSAANDWLERQPLWEARVGGKNAITCTFAEAGDRSHARRAALEAWGNPFAGGGFDWVAPPVLNPFTRLAAIMCPAKGELRVVGYETLPGDELPRPVTHVCELKPERVAA